MNNKTVIRLPKRKNRNRIPVAIIGTLALMTISLFLDRCLEGNQIKATAAIDGESNTGSTLIGLSFWIWPEHINTTCCSVKTPV